MLFFVLQIVSPLLLGETVGILLVHESIEFFLPFEDVRVKRRTVDVLVAPFHRDEIVAWFARIVSADDRSILQMFTLHLHSKRAFGTANFHGQLPSA